MGSVRRYFGLEKTVVVQSLNHVQLSVTPWTAAHQASLSFTVSQSLLRLMCIESVMPSNHLILNILYSTILNFKRKVAVVF